MNTQTKKTFDTFDAALFAAIASLREDEMESVHVEMDAAEFLQLVEDANR